MACLEPSWFGALSVVGHNAVQAAVTSSSDVAALVLWEEIGTHVDSSVGSRPSFSRKLIVVWWSLMKAFPRMAAWGGSRTARKEMRNILFAGVNTMIIMQDSIASIGETSLFRELAARINPVRRIYDGLPSLKVNVDGFREDR